MPEFSTIISLVGENPLPILLGIRQFAAPSAINILVHSADTYTEAENIRKRLPTGMICDPKLHLKELSSPYEPATMRTLMRAILATYPDAALNYTGGTKVMSAFSLYQMSKSMKEENVLSQAFYLEEERELFHFGNETDVEMDAKVTLTLDDLCALHGVDPNKLIHPEPLSLINMRQIFDGYENFLGTNIERLPDKQRDYPVWLQKHRNNPNGIWQRFLSLLVSNTRQQWESDATTKRLEIVKGKWMEQLVKRLVQCLGADMQTLDFGYPQPDPLIPISQIVMEQEFFTDPNKDDYRKFELDVLAIHKRKLFCFSVTTSRTLKLCKGKMFEVQKRAQQVGGGLARSCVVCLLDQGDVDICRNSLSDAPTHPGKARHTIFGAQDVTDWMDGRGHTLFEFLAS